jgi:hypothetical protein
MKDTPMINSISLEKNRFPQMLDLLKGRDCQVVALEAVAAIKKEIPGIKTTQMLLGQDDYCMGFMDHCAAIIQV